MMGKLDAMLKDAGANVGESMGEGRGAALVHRAPGGSVAGMPARLQGVVKAGNAAEIPLAKIKPDAGQPREEFDEAALDRLAESLRARGQLQPIRVRWDEGQGAYVIIAGERRWRAAGRAGLKTMTCMIHDREIPPAELLAMQVVENMLREDLRPIEQARAFKSLMDLHGWPARQLARELAIDHSGVVRALALLDLPEEVQERVEQGALPAATAYELSKVKDPDEQAELAARVVSEGLSRAETARVVHGAPGRKATAKGRGASQPRKVTSRVFRKLAGCTLTVENSRGLAPAMIAEALELALAAVRAEIDRGGQAAA